MSKKPTYDKSLLYDSGKLEELNNQLKTSPIYSHYIWTSGLYAITKISKPGLRPEFKQISSELDKYKEKHAKIGKMNIKSSLILGASSILMQEHNRGNSENSKDLFSKRLESLHPNFSSTDLLRESPVKKYENIYKEIFDTPHLISNDTSSKNQKFVDTILNAKREINPEIKPNKEPERKVLKKAPENKSVALLPYKKSKIRKIKQPVKLPLPIKSVSKK